MSVHANPGAIATIAQANEAQTSYLGEVLWLSAVKTDVPHATVVQAFADAGLSDWCPKLSAPSDVFRRVMARLKKTIHHEDGTRSRITTVQVGDNTNEVQRRVVVEHLDSAGARLSHDQTWDLRYEKLNKRLAMYPVYLAADGTVTSRDRYADPKVGDEYLATVQDDVNNGMTCIDQDGLQRAITKAIKDADGVPVRRNGGVYYVPWEKRHIVAGLKAVATSLEGIEVAGVAVPNDSEQRATVTNAIDTRTRMEAASLITELREAKTGETPIGQRRLATLATDHRKIKERLVKYQEILRDDLAQASHEVEVLSKLVASVTALPVINGKVSGTPEVPASPGSGDISVDRAA